MINIDIFFTLVFFVIFLAPMTACLRGRLRKRTAALLTVGVIVLTLVPLVISLIVFLGANSNWSRSGSIWYSLVGDWGIALFFLPYVALTYWYISKHSGFLRTFGLAFAAAFDPRFNPNQRARGPVGKIAKSKLLTGTKPPTGSRRFVAWRDRMLRDISGKGKR